jgi:hypothetical protein
MLLLTQETPTRHTRRSILPPLRRLSPREVTLQGVGSTVEVQYLVRSTRCPPGLPSAAVMLLSNVQLSLLTLSIGTPLVSVSVRQEQESRPDRRSVY